MFNKILQQIKNKKILLILIGCILLGLILILIGSGANGDKETKEDFNDNINEYTDTLENKLEKMINSIAGVSESKVMISLKSGSEYIYAADDNTNSEKHIIVDNRLVYVKEYLPQIEGVAVVCKGGDDTVLKTKITELVCSVLGLYSTHVFVSE